MKQKDNNMITTWLKNNGNPEIEINVLNEAIDKLIEQLQIAYLQQDEFAIDFADWIRVCKLKSRPYDFENIEELLEIYKKEKGL
jgi:hypothetical protein